MNDQNKMQYGVDLLGMDKSEQNAVLTKFSS
jgi:hypothetical protein